MKCDSDRRRWSEKPIFYFEPDLFVVPAADGRRPRADVPVLFASLVVEVLSPGSLRHDRATKRRYYQRSGIPEYWVVDLESELVERWRPDDDRPEIIEGTIDWRPISCNDTLQIDLRAAFAAIQDD